MRIHCISVRLKSLEIISEKAYRATSWDGSSDIIPASQIFGPDMSVQKSEAYWISSWILERKNIQYSKHKECWFDSNTGNMLPTYTVEKHIPDRVTPRINNEIIDLHK